MDDVCRKTLATQRFHFRDERRFSRVDFKPVDESQDLWLQEYGDIDVGHLPIVAGDASADLALGLREC